MQISFHLIIPLLIFLVCLSACFYSTPLILSVYYLANKYINIREETLTLEECCSYNDQLGLISNICLNLLNCDQSGMVIAILFT